MPLIFSAAAEPFLSVTICAALVVPSAWLEKDRVVGAMVTLCPAARMLPSIMETSRTPLRPHA